MHQLKLSSLPSIKRLPSYLHIVETFQKDGREYISGTVIAEELELEPIQVRKDLALTGVVGKPRLGFPVNRLIEAINRFLDWHHNHQAIVLGAGHLGNALLGYAEFPRHGLNVIAAFDVDPQKQGTSINDVPIYPLEKLAEIITEKSISIAILTVPNQYAQDLADLLISQGITAIWNFTNVKLKVPKDVIVQKEDLSSGYAVLSVKIAKYKSMQWKHNDR